jgi:hypothetical protein
MEFVRMFSSPAGAFDVIGNQADAEIHLKPALEAYQ